MGGTLNRLNCAKNKAKKNENVNIMPHHGSGEGVDDVMHRLETGNSPTKLEENGRGRLPSLHHRPSLLNTSLHGMTMKNRSAQPPPPPGKPSTKVKSVKGSDNLLERLQGMHRKHRQQGSTKIPGNRQKRNTVSMTSNDASDQSNDTDNIPKRSRSTPTVKESPASLQRRRSLPKIKKKLPDEDILNLAFTKIFRDGLRDEASTYSPERFRIVLGSVLASARRSPPSRNEMQRLINLMNGKSSTSKSSKAKKNNRKNVIKESKYMKIVSKMMELERGKEVALPKSLRTPIDDMVSYSKRANSSVKNDGNLAAQPRQRSGSMDSDTSVLTSSSSSVAFDANNGTNAHRLTPEEELQQCRKFRLFIRIVMRSYESKVMFLHKAYKVYSNPRTNLLGYEELHNLLMYLAPGKIYEPSLEESCLILGVIKKAGGSRIPKTSTLDNVKVNEKDIMLWFLKGIYQSDREMTTFVTRSEMHQKIYYCLQGFLNLSSKEERRRLESDAMLRRGSFSRGESGADVVTQKEIIKTIMEEEGPNINLKDMEAYEDFFPNEEKPKKSVSVMPVESHS